jgi:hypothetical protein
VLVVFPVVLGLSLLIAAALGQPAISHHTAEHVLESLHLLGPSVLFAAFTGVLLFSSSLIAGWTENWFVLNRLDSAMEYNPRITRLLGAPRAARWARFLRENISGFAANVSLGFMLGLVPAFAAFFGLGRAATVSEWRKRYPDFPAVEGEDRKLEGGEAEFRAWGLRHGKLRPENAADLEVLAKGRDVEQGDGGEVPTRAPAPDDDEDEGTVGALGKLTQAVDDLESSQVQAVQAQAQKEVLISFVLPFVDAEPIELQFRRAPQKEGQERPPLVVNVHSRSEDLGEVWLKTQLQGLERVELTMWALREGVVEQARQRSGELGAQLAQAGLAMQSFQVIHGARPLGSADWVPSGRGLVIDIRA